MPRGAVPAQDCVRRVDIAGLDAAARQRVIAEEAQAAAGRLAPSDGAMLQAVWFDAGRDASGRLLLAIHHLAVDGVSWRILLPDLEAAWTAAVRGEHRIAARAHHVVPALGAGAGRPRRNVPNGWPSCRSGPRCRRRRRCRCSTARSTAAATSPAAPAN